MRNPPDPTRALDYPDVGDDDLYVFWSASGDPWPAANRQISYVSNAKRHPLLKYALFTNDIKTAATFFTPLVAAEWLQIHAGARGAEYAVTLSTVRELKIQRGYSTENVI